MTLSEHVADRIRWKASKHELPYPNTNYWELAPDSLSVVVADHISDPLVYSISKKSQATIIGSDATLYYDGKKSHTIPHTDICSITSRKDIPKDKLAEIALETHSGQTFILHTEQGSPCFAIWSILLMISRMNLLEDNKIVDSTPRS